MNYQENRQKVIDWTKKQLIGGYPLKDNCLVGINPIKIFKAGYLSGRRNKEDDQIEEIDSDLEDGSPMSSKLRNEAKSIQKLPRYMPASSAGFSFYVTGKDIEIRVNHKAFSYKCENFQNIDTEREDSSGLKKTGLLPEKVHRWRKKLLSDSDGDEVIFTPDGVKKYSVLHDKATIDSIWRPQEKGGYIVTISISNNQGISSAAKGFWYSKNDAESSLFEVECKCIFDKGSVKNYPSMDRDLLSDEEKEIELRYKDNLVLAIGHGVGTNWGKNSQGKMEIWIDFMPSVEVPTITSKTDTNPKILSFQYLKDADNPKIIESLKEFVNDYKKWSAVQNEKASKEMSEDVDTAHEIVKKQQIACNRMTKGIELLKKDPVIRKSFAIANEAMLLQMKHSGIKFPSWRPFQLGFILMALESTINEDSEFRDTLDLIWFPTGGGKTEAYLGLMALLFAYRRLKYRNSSGGTVAIMRYTLRLLSTQQFLRATKVVCALELIRKERISELGNEPFTVGLWVGGTVTPNRFHQAFNIKTDASDKKLAKFILHNCPWCSSSFSIKNYQSTEESFNFTCTNRDCDFGKIENNVLPCNVVDDALYKSPPSLLIATVDKFARLTWQHEPQVFFNKNNNRPPELIIQDELHLISGALGSIVGLYEVALDTILSSLKVYPKYIASTATIKNAKNQVKLLYGREMGIFPPIGLRANDSYFAKTISIKEKPGRTYVGFLDYRAKREDSLTPIASNLLVAPNVLFQEEEDFYDSWWTQIVYHSSLRELGNNQTLYKDKIRNQIKVITKRINQSKKDNQELSVANKVELRELKNIKTISGSQLPKHNQTVFTNLQLPESEDNSIDVALTTEIISVGVDVDRLSLMIINGQPSTTAQYIQASSRVGRSDVPGIVFINYYKTQSRSLSHYENFRSYHDSFYRHVEPSSITPFTFQARLRAMHAVVISAVRHSQIGLLENEAAFKFDSEDVDLKKVILKIKNRCKNSIDNKDTLNEIERHIDDIVFLWSSKVEQCKSTDMRLVYDNNGDRAFDSLLCDFSESQDSYKIPWPTLQSMRNIENLGAIEINSLNE